MCQPLMVDYRDESSFSDSLGIVGAGPIGGYIGSAVVANADGFRYVVAPMLDGFAWQGFKVDGNLNVKQNTPGMGLRQPIGSDPVNACYDYFSLGAGTPQVWQPSNYAATGAHRASRRMSQLTFTLNLYPIVATDPFSCSWNVPQVGFCAGN